MSSTDYSSDLTRTISNLVIAEINETNIEDDAFEAGYWVLDEIHSYIRNCILKNGKTRCNTRELANLYTYSYVLGHVDAFRVAIDPPSNEVSSNQVLFKDIYFNDYETSLIVDIGCGPGTVGLALAELWKDGEDDTGEAPESLPINYLGFDIEPEMILLAEDFFNTPLFDDRIEINVSHCQTRIRVENGQEPTKLIFTFHYVFSQEDILDSVDDFIEIIEKTLDEFSNIDDIYLMSSNINYSGERNAFLVFLDRLKEVGLLDKDQKTYIPKHKYQMRKFNCLDGNNIDLFEGSQRYVHTKVFKLSRPE